MLGSIDCPYQLVESYILFVMLVSFVEETLEAQMARYQQYL